MKTKNQPTERRTFLKKTAIAGSGLAIGLSAFPNIAKSYQSGSVRIGIIGTGGRGNWLLKLMQEVPSIKVTACCDTIPERLEKGVSLTEGAKAYSDYRQLLDSKEVDAVIISTPLNLHFGMAKAALEAGKHVFCEKTMTYSIDESVKLTKLVKNTDRVFQVGFQQRVSPLINRVHEIISGGYIGDIQHIYASWNRNGDWRRPVPRPELERHVNWRLYKEYSGGLIAELSSHQLDMVNWMLGATPTKVVGMGGINYWKDGRDTFDNVHLTYEYPNDTKATFTSLTTNSHEAFAVKFYGTKATLEINRKNGQRAFIHPEPLKGANDQVDGVSSATKKIYEKGETIPVPSEYESEDDAIPTSKSLADFARCIMESDKPKADIEVGHKSTVAVHMGIEAVRESKLVQWDEAYGI